MVLIFAENPNDGRSLSTLAQAVRGDLRFKVLREPVSLTRGAGTAAAASWLKRLSDAAKAILVTENVRAGLVHQDADGHDSQGAGEAELNSKLASAGLPCPFHAVVPVQEMEAWWLAHPQETESIRVAWKGRLKSVQRDVEQIEGPKEYLIRLTRTNRNEYKESDSPAIAEKVAERFRVANDQNRPASLERFRQVIEDL